MVVYGGAGPLHASAIAREIGIRRVLIPFSPGHFSAYGMLFSDLRYDYVRSCFQKLDDVAFDDLAAIFAQMEAEGRAAIADSAVQPSSIQIALAADMRYVGQEHAVNGGFAGGGFASRDRGAIKAHFDQVHAVRYGTSAPEGAGRFGQPADDGDGADAETESSAGAGRLRHAESEALLRVKDVYFGVLDGFVPTPVYARTRLRRDNAIAGPALIEEHASTTVLAPGDGLVVDAFGNLVITIGS